MENWSNTQTDTHTEMIGLCSCPAPYHHAARLRVTLITASLAHSRSPEICLISAFEFADTIADATIALTPFKILSFSISVPVSLALRFNGGSGSSGTEAFIHTRGPQ